MVSNRTIIAAPDYKPSPAVDHLPDIGISQRFGTK
jgi:hypothetical protein